MGRVVDSKKVPLVSIVETEGSKIVRSMHNWCDKTTWFPKATRVVEEIATNPISPLPSANWDLVNNSIIDAYHGKIADEDSLLDEENNSYRVSVLVDDVLKTERDPHVGSGGDYQVDYQNGQIQFFSAIADSSVVKVTYHYATESDYILRPYPTTRIVLTGAKLRIATDVPMQDSFHFEFWGDVGAGMQLLGPPKVYKTRHDLENDCDTIRYFGDSFDLTGSGWRDRTKGFWQLEWYYKRKFELLSSLSMELRIYAKNHVEHSGSFAHVTLYGVSEDE